MKVIINGRFLTSRVTGVGRYAREIIIELDKLVKPGQIEMAVPPETNDLPSYKNINVIRTGVLHNKLWEHISFPLYVRKQRGISVNLCSVAPIPSPGIVCIHDMRIKATKQSFSKLFIIWYNLLFANAMRRAKAIITVSEFSKKEICRYYSVNPDRIYVIPPAWQHYKRINYDETTLEKYKLEKNNYYFAIGSLEPNKNLKWIAEAALNNPTMIFAVAGSINRTVFSNGLKFKIPKNMKLLELLKTIN